MIKLRKSMILIFATIGSIALAAEETTVTPTKNLTPQQSQEISDAGVRVLMHIAEARGNLHEKKYDQAKQDLNQAETLVNIIRAELPTYRVKNRIWVAQKHLEYEDVSQVTPDLVPIYADIDFLADYVPTKEARSHLDKAKESLKKGDKKTAQNEFKLAGEALAYREVDLPVSQTENFIKTAMNEISQKKFDQADKSLKQAEQSVQVTADVVNAKPKTTGSSTSNSSTGNSETSSAPQKSETPSTQK